MKKVILHLCADIGSDSRFYQESEDYEVIRVGIDIGVENFTPTGDICGIIANPPCTEFSTVAGFDKKGDYQKGMELVNHCLRIIEYSKVNCNLGWWVIENPAKGKLRDFLGKPVMVYQPWQFGSPWTKQTALWGEFTHPVPILKDKRDVVQIPELWKRKGRDLACLTYLHKSAINLIPELYIFKPLVKDDQGFRSLCSQGFAKAFFDSNK